MPVCAEKSGALPGGSGCGIAQKLRQLAYQQLRVVDDVTVAKAGEAPPAQLRIRLAQPQDGLFHVTFFFSIPAGDVGLRLHGEVCPVEIEASLSGGPDGFQTDVLRNAAQHGLHALLRLPHKAQRPGGHGLFPGRLILLWRHDFEKQPV